MNKVREAFLLAYEYHKHQKYGDEPFLAHPFDVMYTLASAGVYLPSVLSAALLHDIIEDTPAGYHTVKDALGERIAMLVWLCSDADGRNRREKKANSKVKILKAKEENPGLFYEAMMVKMADWYSNVSHAVHNDPGMLPMYLNDWTDFKEMIGTCTTHHKVEYEKIFYALNELMSGVITNEARRSRKGVNIGCPDCDIKWMYPSDAKFFACCGKEIAR